LEHARLILNRETEALCAQIDDSGQLHFSGQAGLCYFLEYGACFGSVISQREYGNR
jgi:hypothetical protein